MGGGQKWVVRKAGRRHFRVLAPSHFERQVRPTRPRLIEPHSYTNDTAKRQFAIKSLAARCCSLHLRHVSNQKKPSRTLPSSTSSPAWTRHLISSSIVSARGRTQNLNNMVYASSALWLLHAWLVFHDPALRESFQVQDREQGHEIPHHAM